MTASFTSRDLVEALLDDGGVDPKDFLDRVTDWSSDLASLGFRPEIYAGKTEHRYQAGNKMISAVQNDSDTVSIGVWKSSPAGFWNSVAEFEHVPNMAVPAKVRGLLWQYFKRRV